MDWRHTDSTGETVYLTEASVHSPKEERGLLFVEAVGIVALTPAAAKDMAAQLTAWANKK